MDHLHLLKNRIDLDRIPFTDRDSRLLLFKHQDTFSIALAESNFDRVPLVPVTDWQFDDGPGEVTTWPQRVDYGAITFTFFDAETLLVVLPKGTTRLAFTTPAESIHTDRRGGVMTLQDAHPASLVYTTGADFVQHEIHETADGHTRVHLTLDAGDGAVLLLNITRTRAFKRWLPDAATIIERNAQRWRDWFAAAPTVPERYQAQYYFAWWVLAINLVYPYFHPHREGMVPARIGYFGIWLWDAYFHALAYRHVDPELAKNQIRIMLDHQLPNGMIPDVVHDDGIVAYTTAVVEAPVTKPPLLAWVALKLYEIDHDKAFLDEIFDPLVRVQNWWITERDTDDNGLCEYQHPYSSGLDDSPLWDQGLPLETPDLNAYLCLQYDLMAQIAEIIGAGDHASDWRRSAEQLAQRLIDLRWDEEAGLFWAARVGQKIDVRTPFNLFPLLTGRMPAAVAERLVETLTDPQQFWGRYAVPTVAFDDPTHQPETMWRGPIWLNVNYLLIDGLLRSGFLDVAQALRQRTLDLVLNHPDLVEYYDPRTGTRPPRAVSCFGWTSALFIDLVLQETRAN